MAQKTITIPQSFLAAVGQLIQDIQKFQTALAQFAQAVTIQSPVSNIQSAQSAMSGVTGRLNRLHQVLTKIGQSLTTGISRIINMMGTTAKTFLNALSYVADFLGPIIGGIVTVVSWTVSFAITAISYAARFGKWLFDKMVGLGDSMLQDYLISSGVLTSVGNLRAFRASFGTAIPGMDSTTLARFALARVSMESEQYLAMAYLGIRANQDTADMAAQAVVAAQKFMKRQPSGLEVRMAMATGLLSFFQSDTVLALRHMTKQEIYEIFKWYQDLRERMKLSPEAERGWRGFSLAMARMWAQVEAIVARALADPNSKFIQSMTKLSNSFVHFIDILIKSPITQEMIERLARAIDKFAAAINNNEFDGWFNKAITLLGQLFQSFMKAIEAFAELARALLGKEFVDPRNRVRRVGAQRGGGRWVRDSQGVQRWVPGRGGAAAPGGGGARRVDGGGRRDVTPGGGGSRSPTGSPIGGADPGNDLDQAA